MLVIPKFQKIVILVSEVCIWRITFPTKIRSSLATMLSRTYLSSTPGRRGCPPGERSNLLFSWSICTVLLIGF